VHSLVDRLKTDEGLKALVADKASDFFTFAFSLRVCWAGLLVWCQTILFFSQPMFRHRALSANMGLTLPK